MHSDHRIHKAVTLMGSTAGLVQLWEVSGDDSREEEEEEYLVFTLFLSELSNGAVLLCWNT